MNKNLLNIILGTSITAMSAGCAAGSEREENDIRKDQGSIVDLPRYDLPIYIDGRYSSLDEDFPDEDPVSDATTASSDNEVISVSPDTIKNVYAAAATKFAQCLVNEGMQFYGAWWCGPCEIQKKIFTSAWPIIEKENYTPCSAPGKEDILPECEDKQVYSLPQARFDGVAVSGWLFLHQFEENFLTLPCHYDGPKIPSESDLGKYVN